MRDLLIECGEALYGPRWQSEMALRLNVNKRTIGRWLSGASPIPLGLREDLFNLLRHRVMWVKDLMKQLKP